MRPGEWGVVWKGAGAVLTGGQSVVCVIAIQCCKSFGIIQYRDFNVDEAKKCEHDVLLGRRFQQLTAFRVPRIIISHCYDIYEHQGPPIPLDSCLHHLQKFNDHINRLRRGLMVWWLCHWDGSFLFRLDGP